MTVLKGPRPVFDDPGQLMAVMEGYFNSRPPDQYTLTGLALAVGTSRKTIENYGKRPGFRQLVEEARLLVEHSYELRLGSGYRRDKNRLRHHGFERAFCVERSRPDTHRG